MIIEVQLVHSNRARWSVMTERDVIHLLTITA